MKKIGMLLIGIIIGAGLTLAPQIYGAGSKLLGNKVDKTLDIKLNGTLIGQGAVIEGTSYLPVRAAANALGLEVNVDSKQVNLTSKTSETANAEQAEVDKNNEVTRLSALIEKSKREITGLESAIANGEAVVAEAWSAYQTVAANPQSSAELKSTRMEIFNSSVAALDDNKIALEKEKQNLADLELQLAELEK